MANQNLAGLRVNDPVITQIIHGYCNAESIAPFVAPVVTVGLRAGKVIKFTKEQFAMVDTRRAPGSTIKRLSTNFTNDAFYLNQHAAAGEVTLEAYEEATNGEARIDLRKRAALRAAQAVMQSWEKEVVDTITDAAAYEANCQVVTSGTDQFIDPACDIERLVQDWREAVRSQIGCYPNSAVIDARTYNAMRRNPVFRDRVKYTSSSSVNLEMIAQWLELERGIKIAQRVALDPATGLLKDIYPSGTMVLFYSPEVKPSQGFTPAEGNDIGMPSAFYTYQLAGYPIGSVERFDEDREVYITPVIAEQSIVATGLGATNKVGAGFLAKGLV